MDNLILPSTEIKVSANNFLYVKINSIATPTDYIVTVLIINEINEEKIITNTYTATTPRTTSIYIISLTKGRIKQVSVSTTQPAAKTGLSRIIIELWHGTKTSNGLFIQTVIAGWVTPQFPINYPISPIRIPFPDNFNIVTESTIINIDPNFFNYSLSKFQTHKIQALGIELTTSAVVATRQLYLVLTISGTVDCYIKANTTQIAGTSIFYNFIINLRDSLTFSNMSMNPLPNILLNSQSKLTSNVVNSDFGDRITELNIAVKTGNSE